MPTLHARIVKALKAGGRDVRVASASSTNLVMTTTVPEHFVVRRCTYCAEVALHMSPNTRGGVSVPVCVACWESMCAMGQYAQAVHGHEKPRPDYPAYDDSGDATLRIRLFKCASEYARQHPDECEEVGPDFYYVTAPLAEAIQWYRNARRPIKPPFGPEPVECSQCGSLPAHRARQDGQKSCRCGVTVQSPQVEPVQYKWPHDPIVVRLVDSDYVLPAGPTWAGTRRRP